MRINNYQFLPATSGASSLNSLGYPLANVMGFCIQAVVTGTLAGTATLQMSNDPVLQSDPSYQPTNWTTYTGSNQSISGAGTAVWNVADVEFTWVRLAYTASSGTGTIAANINTKAISL